MCLNVTYCKGKRNKTHNLKSQIQSLSLNNFKNKSLTLAVFKIGKAKPNVKMIDIREVYHSLANMMCGLIFMYLFNTDKIVSMLNLIQYSILRICTV